MLTNFTKKKATGKPEIEENITNGSNFKELLPKLRDYLVL